MIQSLDSMIQSYDSILGLNDSILGLNDSIYIQFAKTFLKSCFSSK